MKKNKIDLGWGDGMTDLFLAPLEDGVEIIDYKLDNERVHEKCGGKCYYRSRSGLSGAGYITSLSDLTRVGLYRVDTRYNAFQAPQKITDEVSIMLPYAPHEKYKKATLENNPVVILVGTKTVIYCDFYTNMNEILVTLLSGKKLKQEPQILKRAFLYTNNACHRKPEILEIEFFNLFGPSFYPWEFATEFLSEYSVDFPTERVHSVLNIGRDPNGRTVRTTRVGSLLCATEVLQGDPCENLTEALPGWELAETNMVYKVRNNDVYIVGWKLAAEAYQETVERIARFIPDSEREEFKSFVKAHLPSSKYVEFESQIPKLLFFLNKEEQLANVRKGIATKVRTDAMFAAKQFVAGINDKKILEGIPDDLIITLDDSYHSGNCHPGTQAFVDQYFPGKTETTAGELKKHADNWNVMRVFRYIATRNMIGGTSLNLPE